MFAGDSVFDDGFGVVSGEEVEVDAGHFETGALVHAELGEAGVAGADVERFEGAGAGEVDGVEEELFADALAVAVFADGDVFDFGVGVGEGCEDAEANGFMVLLGDVDEGGGEVTCDHGGAWVGEVEEGFWCVGGGAWDDVDGGGHGRLGAPRFLLEYSTGEIRGLSLN